MIVCRVRLSAGMCACVFQPKRRGELRQRKSGERDGSNDVGNPRPPRARLGVVTVPACPCVVKVSC